MIGVTVFVLTFLYLCDICVAPRHHLSSSSAGCGDRVGAAITGLDIKAGVGHIGAGAVVVVCCWRGLLLCCCVLWPLLPPLDCTLLVISRCCCRAAQLPPASTSTEPVPVSAASCLARTHSQHQARQEADLTKHFTLCVAGRQHGPKLPSCPIFHGKI